MRKLILKMHVSLDGYVRAATGDVMGWIFDSFDDQLQAWEVDNLWRAGTHVMGRNVYEEMVACWPNSTQVYAAPMNDIPKVVFSKSLKSSDWANTRICNDDLTAEIARLRQEGEKDILVHGGVFHAVTRSPESHR